MKRYSGHRTCISALLIVLLASPYVSSAATLNAQSALPRTTLSVMPRNISVVEGSTFDVSIVLNTQGHAINGIQLHLRYDKSKLAIVQPSTGKSLIGVWAEPPSYDNTRGIAKYIGVIPGGITTQAGVVGTITFKAKATGSATISIQSDSEVLLNDGLGSSTELERSSASISIVSKPPEGMIISSETHPLSSAWYQNNSPAFSWQSEAGVDGYNYILDDKPNTIPENIVTSKDSAVSYQDIKDGVWYFHVKARKSGAWGTTGHYLFKIDRSPPAEFTPVADHVLSSITKVDRTLVSFFTTDALSGLNRFEIGIIDLSAPETQSPAFVEVQSPYQVPAGSAAGSRIIVRAFDAAENYRDASLTVSAPILLMPFLKDNLNYILIIMLAIMVFTLIAHYLFGHHVIRHVRRAWTLIREEERNEDHSVTTNNEIPSDKDQSSDGTKNS